MDKITSALRKLVEQAEPKVFKDAITVVKDAITEGGVRCPGAYLYRAIAEGWSKGAVRNKREEEFDEAYQELVESGIVEEVEKRYLSIQSNEYMVRLIDTTQPSGYRLINWRKALEILGAQLRYQQIMRLG